MNKVILSKAKVRKIKSQFNQGFLVVGLLTGSSLMISETSVNSAEPLASATMHRFAESVSWVSPLVELVSRLQGLL